MPFFGRAVLAVAPVLAAFPGVGDERGRHRPPAARCGEVMGEEPALRRLEAIVHPLVRAAERSFLEAPVPRTGGRSSSSTSRFCSRPGASGGSTGWPWSSAPAALQRDRALRRPGMTPARLSAILAKQMPDARKRRRADFVIPSGYDRGASAAAVAGLIQRLSGEPGRAWPDLWLRHG